MDSIIIALNQNWQDYTQAAHTLEVTDLNRLSSLFLIAQVQLLQDHNPIELHPNELTVVLGTMVHQCTLYEKHLTRVQSDREHSELFYQCLEQVDQDKN